MSKNIEFGCCIERCFSPAIYFIGYEPSLKMANNYSCREHLPLCIMNVGSQTVETLYYYNSKLEAEYVKETRPWYSWVQRLWEK